MCTHTYTCTYKHTHTQLPTYLVIYLRAEKSNLPRYVIDTYIHIKRICIKCPHTCIHTQMQTMTSTLDSVQDTQIAMQKNKHVLPIQMGSACLATQIDRCIGKCRKWEREAYTLATVRLRRPEDPSEESAEP